MDVPEEYRNLSRPRLSAARTAYDWSPGASSEARELRRRIQEALMRRDEEWTRIVEPLLATLIENEKVS